VSALGPDRKLDRADAKAAMALLRQERERQQRQREITLDPSQMSDLVVRGRAPDAGPRGRNSPQTLVYWTSR